MAPFPATYPVLKVAKSFCIACVPAEPYHPQLLHPPEAETFSPYNDLKTQTYHSAVDKMMQKNINTVQAL
jgi:hypothetical protein